MRYLLTVALGAALLLAAAVPSRALLVSLDPGAPINESTGQIYLDADAIQASGTTYARVNFILGPWSSPTDTTPHGPSSLTWQQTYDTIINSLVSRGIKVYALIGAQAVHSSAASINTDQYVTDYANNFTTIVGMFKDRVRVFESFNEPNNWASGTSLPTVQPYWFADMLQQIYQSVKINNGHASDPSWQVTLISGPLFSHDTDTCASYLASVYQAGKGQLGWNTFKSSYGTYPLDGIGYHIYVAQGSSDPATVTNAINTNLNAIWSTITKYEGSGTSKRLWISEFGWRNTASFSYAAQASDLTLALNLFKNDYRTTFANWFQIADFGASDQWGLYSGALIDANKKPSWQAFHDFAITQLPTGTISGTVRDTNGNLLSGATVASTTGGYSATSGADGSYGIYGVTPGSYSLNASKFGYRTSMVVAGVTAGGTSTASFQLLSATSESSPANIKLLADTSFVNLQNVVVTAAFPDRIYVQQPDRSSGIGVLGVSADPGDIVNVAGFVVTTDGERVLTLGQIQTVSSGGPVPPALGVSNWCLGGGACGNQGAVVNDAESQPAAMADGLNNTGLLVRTTGTVTAADAGAGVFYIDDGAGIQDGSGNMGLRVEANSAPMPSVGDMVCCTGISGVTRMGSFNARMLRLRGPGDLARLYPPIPQPVLVNPGFETATASGWTSYGLITGIISRPWQFGLAAHTGTCFAVFAANNSTRSGGYYQRVSVLPGVTYVASVWSQIYRSGNSVNSTKSCVGIDPTGGTDPASPAIAWSAWNTQPVDSYSAWTQISAPAVVAAGPYVTVFLDALQSETLGWHINCFDDAGLIAQ